MVRSRPHEGPFVAHGGSTTAAAAVVVQAPEEVFVTVTFHRDGRTFIFGHVFLHPETVFPDVLRNVFS